jgi:hypothetical protein
MELFMTLLERIEKKVFFRIVRTITFFVAFFALIAIIGGLYTSIDSSLTAEPNNIQIVKEEIDSVLKVESQPTNKEVKSGTQLVEDNEQGEIRKLAESIAKKIFTIQEVGSTSPNYNADLGRMVDNILGAVIDYDNKTKISVLAQLDGLVLGFKKDKLFNQIDVYLALFKSKFNHEQALADQKNIASQTNKTLAYGVLGGGVVIFALFVMILVLLRIEKNTRAVDSESDEYNSTDKKILAAIIFTGILISVLIGWGLKSSVVENTEFDAVQELRAIYTEQNVQDTPVAEAPVAQEAELYDATSSEDLAKEASPVEVAPTVAN